MSPKRYWWCLLLFGLIGPAADLAAQNVTLSRPAAALRHEFSTISGLRELPDGRVLVADGIDGVVLRADLATGKIDTIGRSGQGPGEYRSPDALFAMPNGGTLLMDLGNGRLSFFDGTGRYVESTPIVLGTPGERPGPPALVIPRGTDATGRIYYQPAGAGQSADSGVVIRWDRKASRFDTVARVKLPEIITRSSGGPNNRNVRQMPPPYPLQDSWAVAADGRVALIRVPTYRVDWAAPTGAVTVGKPLDAPKVSIRDAEKREYLSELASTGMSVQMENNNGQVRMSFSRGRGRGGDEMAEDLASMTWPATKPPVTGFATVAPDGRVWVERSVAAGAPRVYDIVGQNGAAAGQVTLPAGRRLVAVGARGLYARHVDSDGINRLERYDVR